MALPFRTVLVHRCAWSRHGSAHTAGRRRNLRYQKRAQALGLSELDTCPHHPRLAGAAFLLPSLPSSPPAPQMCCLSRPPPRAQHSGFCLAVPLSPRWSLLVLALHILSRARNAPVRVVVNLLSSFPTVQDSALSLHSKAFHLRALPRTDPQEAAGDAGFGPAPDLHPDRSL